MYNQLNKMLYVGTLVFLLSAAVFVGCQSKQEKATEEVKEAVEAQQSATETSDWLAFKESAEKTIADNDARIKVLKENIEKSKTPNLDKIRQTRIDTLEARNTALRAKIMEYREDMVKTNLEQFKASVKQEMDDIEKAFKELDDK